MTRLIAEVLNLSGEVDGKEPALMTMIRLVDEANSLRMQGG